MSLDIDAAAVLNAVIKAPNVFKDVNADLTKFAYSVVLKQLKAKGANVARLRDIQRVIGQEAFILVIESVADDGKSLKTLLARFDKHCPELESAKAPWLRRRIIDLALGVVDPAGRPALSKTDSGKKKPPGSGRTRRTPAKRAISGKAFTATWDGKDRTE